MPRVHRGHVAEALDRALVRATLELLRGPGPLRARVADELPAAEGAVAAVDGVGERALARVVLEHREEAERTRCGRREERLLALTLLHGRGRVVAGLRTRVGCL